MSDEKRFQIRLLEYLASGFAILGTFLMASGMLSGGTAFAWVLWLLGSIGFCVWAAVNRAWGVLVLNLTYVALDIMGLARTFLH